MDVINRLPVNRHSKGYISMSLVCFFNFNNPCFCFTLRKKCLYSEFFWSVFPRIWTEFRQVFRISSYSVRMREITDQKNSEYGHFSCSAGVNITNFKHVVISEHEIFLTIDDRQDYNGFIISKYKVSIANHYRCIARNFEI